MKFWIRIILLTTIDFAIIWLWVKQMNPDPSISIGILILVPLVVILNLIIALILYFRKKEFVALFLVNSIISGILMFYLFGIDRYQNNRLESWNFKLKDETYTITHWKLENTFSMSESNSPGSSAYFLEGKFIRKGDESYLTTDSTEFMIKKGYLYKFRNESDSIKLTKIER